MDTFSALVEPNRRLILNAIRDSPCTVNMLVAAAGISQPAVSKHLKCLRQANLVIVKPEGQKRWYALNPAPLEDLEAFLAPYRKFLSTRLESHVDGMPHIDEPV